LQKSLLKLEKLSRSLPPHRYELAEQPLDRLLLMTSPLFLKSRRKYLTQGGKFNAALVSTPRTLSSSILLEDTINYSPIQSELFWAAHSGSHAHFEELRTYTASTFHEQNHRLFWKILPPIPQSTRLYHRYLNFAESLVIMMDMALGDELGDMAEVFYLTGSTYDPGTSVRSELKKSREYRNYLQAALFATYLNLELYDPRDVKKVIRALYPALGSFADRAAERASRLDRAFILRTNLVWQKKNRKSALAQLSRAGVRPLELPSDPLDNRLQYLLGEKVLDLFGV
jgi:hypothetical protein